jgi:hypothetical protein
VPNFRAHAWVCPLRAGCLSVTRKRLRRADRDGEADAGDAQRHEDRPASAHEGNVARVTERCY